MTAEELWTAALLRALERNPELEEQLLSVPTVSDEMARRMLEIMDKGVDLNTPVITWDSVPETHREKFKMIRHELLHGKHELPFD